MADFKVKYPASGTVALTISLASLADDNTNGLAGRQSAAVDNSSDLDIDHLLSGVIRLGTSPTAGRTIELWVAAPIAVASGTPTWPDAVGGSDAARSWTSRNVLMAAAVPLPAIVVDATSNRDYFIRPTSIANLFGGALPRSWVLWVLNRTAVALNSTGGNHSLQYERIQSQTV